MASDSGNIRVPTTKKATLGAAILGALLTVFSGWFMLTAFHGSLVRASYDLPFAYRPVVAPQEVVMVYLDEISHEKLHQKYGEIWNRAFHTKLLARLTADHAKAVVFDLMFSDPMDPETDHAFARAMETNGSVVIATERLVVQSPQPDQTQMWLSRPYALFVSRGEQNRTSFVVSKTGQSYAEERDTPLASLCGGRA